MNATTRKKGLGRGLEALLGAQQAPNPEPEEVVYPSALPLGRLRPGKYQPRTRMDEGALQELASSIRAQGLMQPILVRPIGGGDYEIIAGERRFRAAALAGLAQVPVLVKDVADQAAAAMALIENIQREDLNPLEEAQGIQRLLEEFAYTHEQAAEAVGRSRSAVSNLLRLLQLSKPVQTMLLAGDLDMGHARALLAVDAATQITLANRVVNARLSVRETEKLAAQENLEPAGETSGKRRAGAVRSGDVARLEELLSDSLGATAEIKLGRGGKGRLMIDFGSLDALDGILARLGVETD
ncbi:MAG: ParB/RepB/Spo0J family partition protein [Janthinobacterium lividum]